jgi:DNA helicase-2/ATP-dependent DNA helicase PcrA
MKFTNEQYEAIKRNDDAALFACPGAGKTRVIAGKVIRVVNDDPEDPRKIACITFTNGALEEIERRLSSSISAELAERYTAATIHSFLLNEVVAPYQTAVAQIPVPVRIAAPESDVYKKSARLVFGGRLNERILRALSQSRRLKDGSPSAVRLVSTNETLQFWGALAEAGYIDYSGIIYFAYVILSDSAKIARLVASRFSWFVIDEYQDCSDLVLDCLSIIREAGSTRFFIVGDYDQAIYSFNGVSLQALDSFLNALGAERLALNGSRRLPERIAAVASCILEKEPPIRSECDPPEIGAVAIRRLADVMAAIFGVFIPTLQKRAIAFERAAIIASTGDALKSIYLGLLEKGYAAVLCGDRLYRKGSITTFLEAAVAYYFHRTVWTFNRGRAATASMLYENALILRDASLTAPDELFIAVVEGLGALINRGGTQAMTNRLADLASIIAAILSAKCISGDHFNTCLGALAETVDSIGDIPHPYEMTWDALAEHAVRSHSMSLVTIHGSKGLEYDAVAVVALNNDTLPFFAAEDIDEEKRKLFVAATRATKALLLASDNAGGNAESPFLRPIRLLASEWKTAG